MNISKGTIIRTAVLAVALLNQLLVVMGKSPLPFDDELVTEIVAMILTTAASIVAWWKNNSFTKKAITADAYLKELKER